MSDPDISNAPVVVGVDGSAAGDAALDWAVSEASAAARPLHIVHALASRGSRSPSLRGHLARHTNGTCPPHVTSGPKTVLARAVWRAQAAAPDLEIVSAAVVGAVVPTLLRRAVDAELLVVGSRGPTDRTGRLNGSIGVAMATRARCPVIVVHAPRPGDPAPDSTGAGRRVVVVADGSDPSRAATRFAFEYAAQRHLTVAVVRLWAPPLSGYQRLVVGLPQLLEEEQREMWASVAAHRLEFPEVEVEAEVVRTKHDHHRRTLIEQSANAALLVLGCHAHSGFAGLLPDVVLQSVLEHAHCPVAMVKPAPAPTSAPTTAQATAPATVPTTVPTKDTGSSDDAGVAADDALAPSSSSDAPWPSEVTTVLRWLNSN